MSSPYQPEPGCTARQRQLEQQVHDLRQQLRAAEDELGPLRQRVDAFQIGAIEREALLADARDLLEPWGGHGDDWPAIAPAITTLIGKLAEVTAPCLIPPPVLVGLGIAPSPCIVTGPHIKHRDADGAMWWERESSCTNACSEGHTYEPPCELATRHIEPLEEQLAEARMWARHGYELGQRSLSWSDHGVAPAWLTEGHDPQGATLPEDTGNAEDCPKCRERRDLPYPFLCSGHPAQAEP